MIKNNKDGGMLRFFIYYDKPENEFVGVCIDLGIVLSGDNPYVVERDLTEASMGYIEAVEEKGLPDELLNQKPPREYLELFHRFVNFTAGKKITARQLAGLGEARTFVRPVPA